MWRLSPVKLTGGDAGRPAGAGNNCLSLAVGGKNKKSGKAMKKARKGTTEKADDDAMQDALTCNAEKVASSDAAASSARMTGAREDEEMQCV